MAKGDSFSAAYTKAFSEICPNGLNEIEQETILLLTSKRIIAMKEVMYFIGLVTAISVSIGRLFNVLNWPGGGDLFTYGFLGFVLIFLPMLAIDRYKLAFNKVLGERLKIILGFASAIITGLAVMFKLMHLQGASILLVVGVILFSFGFLPFYFSGCTGKPWNKNGYDCILVATRIVLRMLVMEQRYINTGHTSLSDRQQKKQLPLWVTAFVFRV